MSQRKYSTKKREFKHLDMYKRGKIEVGNSTLKYICANKKKVLTFLLI